MTATISPNCCRRSTGFVVTFRVHNFRGGEERMHVVLNAASQSQLVGRYQLLEFLGSGGMSDVFVALHTGLRKRVAIKLLRPFLRHDAEAVRRFLREGECAARVSHPNVVHVTDVGMAEQGLPFLVMELLDGVTLEEELRREGPLSLEAAVDLLLPIIEGVSAAHAAGVLHRDIKPGNILLARLPDGTVQPKLVDFGIATLTERRNITGALGPIGTPHYMSPEQARGGALDFTSDLYSLASVLFEMVTGDAPFGDGSVHEVLERVGRGRFPRVRALHGHLPAELDQVLERATAFEPERRYASTAEFASALVVFAGARTQALYESRELRTPERASRPVIVARDDAAYSTSRGPLALPAVRSLFAGRHARWLLLPLFVSFASLCGAYVGTDRAPAASLSELRGAAVAARESAEARVMPQNRPHTQRLIALSPAHAVATLDGEPVGSGMVLLPSFHDGKVHELRVSAKGHITRVLLFRRTLDGARVALDKL
jgi:hypothetical protein